MARSFIRTTTGCFQSTALGTLTNYPFTLACWVNFQVLPSIAGADAHPLSIDHADFSGFTNTVALGVSATSNNILSLASDNSGNFFNPTVISGAAITTNMWIPLLFVCLNATSRTQYAFIAGTLQQTTDIQNCPFGLTQFTNARIGAYAGSSTTASSTTGFIDNCVIWSAALTQAEVLAFCRGGLPTRIRPQSIVNWWPVYGLSASEPDLGGKVNTATNSTAATAALAPGSPTMMFTPRQPQPLFISLLAPEILMPAIQL